MNRYLIYYFIGNYLLLFAGCFLPSIFWAAYFREWQMLAIFAIVSIATFILGGTLVVKTKQNKEQLFTKREGLLTVCFIWIISGVIGAFPFYFSGYFPSFISALFETISGFTTTGASVLSDIESLPQSLLFWRSLTHWLGGLGIVVLFIILLPQLGVGGKLLFSSEVPGPQADVLTPKVRETAILLLKIYLFFTVVETILLYMAGMSFFDALCHTFGTLATGGYSTKNSSIAYFQNVKIEIIIIFFMFVAGVNFSLYYYFLQGKRGIFRKDTEFKAYLSIILLAITAIVINLSIHMPDKISSHIRDVTFQVVSVQTSTGYGTADFDKWPDFSRLILFGLMFVGGCAGSTGGGFKVIRWVIIFKYIYHQIEQIFRPHKVVAVRIAGYALDEKVVKNVVGLFCLWIIVFGVVTLSTCAMGYDMVTSASAAATTLNNIGPGFLELGPTKNFGDVPDLGKFLFIICMLFGRLEIYTFIILFHPAFWEK